MIDRRSKLLAAALCILMGGASAHAAEKKAQVTTSSKNTVVKVGPFTVTVPSTNDDELKERRAAAKARQRRFVTNHVEGLQKLERYRAMLNSKKAARERARSK